MNSTEPQAEAVVFRKWKDTGDVIALFPNMPEGFLIGSYMHVGQHGAANYTHVMSQTVPATPAEYSALFNELQAIGYTLSTYSRKPGWCRTGERVNPTRAR